MKASDIDRLVRICSKMENLNMSLEDKNMAEISREISAICSAMQETVGRIMLDRDEMTGALE